MLRNKPETGKITHLCSGSNTASRHQRAPKDEKKLQTSFTSTGNAFEETYTKTRSSCSLYENCRWCQRRGPEPKILIYDYFFHTIPKMTAWRFYSEVNSTKSHYIRVGEDSDDEQILDFSGVGALPQRPRVRRFSESPPTRFCIIYLWKHHHCD